MLVSNIKLYRRGSHFEVRIDHNGMSVKSGKHSDACAAYRDAESRLIYKPSYVNSVPKE